jgi:hypothetical protein
MAQRVSLRIESALRSEGATIRVIYDPNGKFRPYDGDAVKSYGLWIDGEEVASAESALNTDRVLAFVVMPALGLLSIGIGYVTFKKFSVAAARRRPLSSG